MCPRHRASGFPEGAGAVSLSAVLTGLHAIVFSPEAEKVRAFFGDVLGLDSVDAGGGWPIYAMPPAELAVHPSDTAGRHALYLMCDDIGRTLAELRGKGVEVVGDVRDAGWGLLASVRLPDGSELPIYEPRHRSPIPPGQDP
jgi:catechol 2,3-dioxygenase-like lactoylglutathione lyase family enzyme